MQHLWIEVLAAISQNIIYLNIWCMKQFEWNLPKPDFINNNEIYPYVDNGFMEGFQTP